LQFGLELCKQQQMQSPFAKSLGDALSICDRLTALFFNVNCDVIGRHWDLLIYDEVLAFFVLKCLPKAIVFVG
jgi:hypothetical protein